MEQLDFISRSIAKDRIFKLCNPYRTYTPRQAKNKISQRLRDWIKAKKLDTNEAGLICFKSLCEMVRDKFGGNKQDWPLSKARNYQLFGETGHFQLESKPILPLEIGLCHTEIINYHAEIAMLKKENLALTEQIRLLEPDALKYRKFCYQNKINGLKAKKYRYVKN
jgi:hypothetical protein